MAESPWLLLVYRVPTEPASKRVTVWRDLKRLGSFYLQQCVCALPDRPDLRAEIERITEKIETLGGEHTLFEIPRLRVQDEARIIESFRTLRNNEYQEIIEECETKFVKEIEFEHFRQNYSFEEAEEIGQDLEKIRRWFDRIIARDWFGASLRPEVEHWIEHCAELLSDFEHTVYLRNPDDATSEGTEPLQSILLPRPLPRRDTSSQSQKEKEGTGT
ncbi:MAG TPA: Chromate resistance protein ChrB [Nitrolancea sp.]|nr:Chromate resistance protein ChrB [Nitrolancea sp.]